MNKDYQNFKHFSPEEIDADDKESTRSEAKKSAFIIAFGVAAGIVTAIAVDYGKDLSYQHPESSESSPAPH